MFQILAILNPPTVVLILVLLAITLILVIPKLKKSDKVEKLADDLFKAPEKRTTDGLINQMKDAKDGLVDKVKKNADTVKKAIKDSEKISKNL